MKLSSRPKAVDIRISSGGYEHSSFDSLRNNFCVTDVLPLIRNGQFYKWLSQIRKDKIVDDIKKLEFIDENKIDDVSALYYVIFSDVIDSPFSLEKLLLYWDSKGGDIASKKFFYEWLNRLPEGEVESFYSGVVNEDLKNYVIQKVVPIQDICVDEGNIHKNSNNNLNKKNVPIQDICVDEEKMLHCINRIWENDLAVGSCPYSGLEANIYDVACVAYELTQKNIGPRFDISSYISDSRFSSENVNLNKVCKTILSLLLYEKFKAVKELQYNFTPTVEIAWRLLIDSVNKIDGYLLAYLLKEDIEDYILGKKEPRNWWLRDHAPYSSKSQDLSFLNDNYSGSLRRKYLSFKNLSFDKKIRYILENIFNNQLFEVETIVENGPVCLYHNVDEEKIKKCINGMWQNGQTTVSESFSSLEESRIYHIVRIAFELSQKNIGPRFDTTPYSADSRLSSANIYLNKVGNTILALLLYKKYKEVCQSYGSEKQDQAWNLAIDVVNKVHGYLLAYLLKEEMEEFVNDKEGAYGYNWNTNKYELAVSEKMKDLSFENEDFSTSLGRKYSSFKLLSFDEKLRYVVDNIFNAELFKNED